MLSGLLNIVCACVQTMNKLAVVCMQGRGQLSIAAADMNIQPALNVAVIKYGLCLLCRACCRCNGGE